LHMLFYPSFSYQILPDVIYPILTFSKNLFKVLTEQTK
jgi:hypothetical protein